jgi:integrase
LPLGQELGEGAPALPLGIAIFSRGQAAQMGDEGSAISETVGADAIGNAGGENLLGAAAADAEQEFEGGAVDAGAGQRLELRMMGLILLYQRGFGGTGASNMLVRASAKCKLAGEKSTCYNVTYRKLYPMTPAAALVPASDPWHDLARLVLDAVSSPVTRLMYAKALADFFLWWEGQGRPPFQRATVQAHRAWLEGKSYAPSTVNQRLAAIKKLAREAAANGWLPQEIAGAIASVPGAKQQGTRAGNWLTKAQAEALLHAPDPSTLKGKRDRIILALLVGCGLRRAEAVQLSVEDVQQRDSRWVLVDLRGKHGRIRTVPVPAWVQQALEIWTAARPTDFRDAHIRSRVSELQAAAPPGVSSRKRR